MFGLKVNPLQKLILVLKSICYEHMKAYNITSDVQMNKNSNKTRCLLIVSNVADKECEDEIMYLAPVVGSQKYRS